MVVAVYQRWSTPFLEPRSLRGFFYSARSLGRRGRSRGDTMGPPGTELSLGWRPRRHACCGPTPPGSKPYVACAMAALSPSALSMCMAYRKSRNSARTAPGPPWSAVRTMSCAASCARSSMIAFRSGLLLLRPAEKWRPTQGAEYVESWRRGAGARNGREGYPYRISVTTEEGKPLVSFAYASRALAEVAATHLKSALLNAISVHPYAE